VDTGDEVHLFPYGYFQHSRLVRQSGREVVQIQFQDRMITIKGKGLEALNDALERLAVVRINVRPEKYAALDQNAGLVETIEIVEIGKNHETFKT
jgi:hypothetical protein